MGIKIRRANERGSSKTSWLDSKHTFSFGEYYDKDHMGFGVLRVLNDDKVSPNTGFASHSHTNMEIISYILDGELKHNDSLGNGSIIMPGDVQRMSAGSGVTHSEYNPSSIKANHFLQIWIKPKEVDIAPSYEQINFSTEEKLGKFKLVASGVKSKDVVYVHQDINMYACVLNTHHNFSNFIIKPNTKVWIHIALGQVKLNQELLVVGDGVEITEECELSFVTDKHTEIVLLEMY